mmetsp:Transcript_7304/g.10338  ORF Transcript_7304/g.10338 Transcript_7304/m.10338 type:complete len:339 (+) Transcript_7304:219-1235(+)
MMYSRLSIKHFLALVSAVAVHAQLPCPPIPELADVVDTLEKCDCFYALIGSKLDFADASTYGEAMNEDTVYHYAQTGTYFGPEGVKEMLSWIDGGEFVKVHELVGNSMILDMTGSTAEQCFITVGERRRVEFNTKYTENNEEVCIESLNGINMYYTMTGNIDRPILISRLDTWCPDGFFRGSHRLFSSTKATAEYVCDVMLNVCKTGKKKKKSEKIGKKGKKLKLVKGSEMESCIQSYNELPLWHEVGGRANFDGNSKGCRVLHSYWATNRAYHCPHVTLSVTDKDDNGFIRCAESGEGHLDTDYFSQETLDLFRDAGLAMGLGEESVIIQVGGGCPS